MVQAEPELERLLRPVSQRALKHWLKVQGLPHSAPSEEALLGLLSRAVAKGKVTIAQLATGVREIEESGGKRIHLRKCARPDALKSREGFNRHLETLGLTLASAPFRPATASVRPKVVYVTWAARKDPQVRVRFSETHRAVEVDYESQTFETQEVPKVIVAIADIESAAVRVQVRLDKPEKLHPHRDDEGSPSESLYESYYLERTREILGCKDLQAEDLRHAARWLVETSPYVFEIPSEQVLTGAGFRQKYSGRGDVRNDPARQAAAAADGKNWLFENIQGYWIPEHSGDRIHRRLFMQLKRDKAMLRFLADCLADEADYAISTIRSVQGGPPKARPLR